MKPETSHHAKYGHFFRDILGAVFFRGGGGIAVTTPQMNIQVSDGCPRYMVSQMNIARSCTE